MTSSARDTTLDTPPADLINRELSWLAFNARVVEEAENANHPLLERVKFLSIAAATLDEFYMVRVAGLRGQIEDGDSTPSQDGMAPQDQLAAIAAEAHALIDRQAQCWEVLRRALVSEGIRITALTELDAEDRAWLRGYFADHIFPALTPVKANPSYSPLRHSFPLLPNLGLTMILSLVRAPKNDMGKEPGQARDLHAIIPLPGTLPRFVRMAAGKDARAQEIRFLPLEDVLSLCQEQLFPGCRVRAHGLVRAVRDSELDLPDEAGNLVDSVESALKKRRQGDVVRLDISGTTPPALRALLLEETGAAPEQVMQAPGLLGLSALAQFHQTDHPGWAHMKFPPLVSRFPERINDFGGDCFAAISAKDIVVHHPYESFDVVVQFIRQAANDPDVVAIKQTLYRTSSDSPIVRALIEAARAGKAVTVVVEMKARFDEEANLRWGRGLEEAGAQVIYGLPRLKIHAKVLLILRREGAATKSYAHFGTGNYHPVTARIYTDLSFFTCDPDLCHDAAMLFHYMTGYTPTHRPQDISFRKLAVAPLDLRERMMMLIDAEIAHAKAGRPAGVWIKTNALVDRRLIGKLYEASRAGVSVELVVRGICCLRPGVPGMSENIRVRSIVGRFLEHGRVFCFGAGHKLPSPENKVFIASADLMYRNMNRRVEVMVPVENATVHEQVLNQIMSSNLKDTKQSWILNPDGTYRREAFSKESFSAHEYFLSNPSLSGRGTARHGGRRKPPAETVPPPAALPAGRIAVIDIGSNSVRLVVYDGLKRAPLLLANEKVLCGLARGMDKTGRLNPDGVERAAAALDRFTQIVRAMNAREVSIIATAAVRDAGNGPAFARSVEQRSGLPVRILTGEEEARLAALGVIAAMHEADGVAGDLGGGSLELARITLAHGTAPDAWIGPGASLPVGPLRMQNLDKGALDEHLAKFPLKEMLAGKTFYAVGGGFRALAKIDIAMRGHPLNIIQNYDVSAKKLFAAAREIAAMPPAKIVRLPSVSPSRADTLAATALIMERILALGEPARVVFSAHGVREGLLFDRLPPQTRREDALIAGARDMITRIAPDSGAEWDACGQELYQWTGALFPRETADESRLRQAACLLSRIAWHEHTSYRAEMAYRWMLDAELPAVSHRERVFIALALFYRYRSARLPDITGAAEALLDSEARKNARILGLALRLGYQISGAAPRLLPRVTLSIQDKKLALSCRKQDKALLDAAVLLRLEKLAGAVKKEPCII